MNLESKIEPSITARVLLLLLLVTLAIYATLYTVAAHNLASWGWSCRGSQGDATFLPFPTGPRGVLMDVIAKMNPVDEFIYLYLIKTGALIVISISLWTIVAVVSSDVFLRLQRSKATSN